MSSYAVIELNLEVFYIYTLFVNSIVSVARVSFLPLVHRTVYTSYTSALVHDV
jgi:hypothetical protein